MPLYVVGESWAGLGEGGFHEASRVLVQAGTAGDAPCPSNQSLVRVSNVNFIEAASVGCHTFFCCTSVRLCLSCRRSALHRHQEMFHKGLGLGRISLVAFYVWQEPKAPRL